MYIRIIAYHETELIPGSDMRKVIAESTHQADAFWFKGDTLRDLYIELRGVEKMIGIIGSCTIYFMNDDGSNFDKRHFYTESLAPITAPIAAAA